ncbi:MAG: hypothetical protein ACREQL_11990 [Candidatus Binatia bacterium]
MTSPAGVLRMLALVAVVAVTSHRVEAQMGRGGGGGHSGGQWHGGAGSYYGGGGPRGGWGGGRYYGPGPRVVFGAGFGFYDPFFYSYPFYPYRYAYPYTYAYPAYPYAYPPPYYGSAAPSPDSPDDSSPPGDVTPPSDSTPPGAQGGSPYADSSTYGLIQLRDVPNGAAIDLDGRFWLEAHDLGKRWLAVPSGAHTIVVRAQGFEPAERRLDLGAGERQVIRVGRLREDRANVR